VREGRTEAGGYSEFGCPWLEQADTSGIAAFRTFAAGLRRDEAAVQAALKLKCSQGQAVIM
jgi:transposase